MTLMADNLGGNIEGFTLVEMLVAIAIMGILSTTLMQMVAQVGTALQVNRAQGDMFTNLHVAGQQLSKDLRKFARNRSDSPVTRFLGIDGDGTFENTNLNDHSDLSHVSNSNPEAVDQLHLHINYSDQELTNHLGSASSDETKSASERTKLSFYLAHGNVYNPLAGEWGLMKKRTRHQHEDVSLGQLVPPITDDPDISGQTGAAPMGFNIDYLSFRYYDAENNTWHDNWDSKNHGGKAPAAVEIAMRAYDPGGSESDAATKPLWYQTMVSLRSK